MSIKIDKAKLLRALGFEGDYNSWNLKKYFLLDISYTGLYDIMLSSDAKKAIITYTGYDSTYMVDIENETMERFIFPASIPTYYPAHSESIMNIYCALKVGGYMAWIFKDGVIKHGIDLPALLGFSSEFCQANPIISKDGKTICFLCYNTSTHDVYFVVLEGSSEPITPIGYQNKGSQTASVKGVLRASKFRTDKHYIATKLYVYLKELSGTDPIDVRFVIYNASLEYMNDFVISIEAGFEGWALLEVALPIAKDTDYWLGVWASEGFTNDVQCYFDDGETNQMAIQNVLEANFPPNPMIPDSYENKKLSIYWV